MPVNLTTPVATELLPVKGVLLGTAEANIKKPNRKDLLLIQLTPQATVAGVFTQNRFCAAPVIVAQEHMAAGQGILALVINTGNANAGTGELGLAAARATCAEVATILDCEAQQVLPFSTGVIMEALPLAKLLSGLPGCVANLREDNWFDAAHAIMTTDIVAKAISRQITFDDIPITITGIAKGSGMIHPDMATMLCFIMTDANIASPLLKKCLLLSVETSFNSITVDGDTSTNDMILCMANGAAGNKRIAAGTKELKKFQACLDAVAKSLARQVVRDGEGATKFVEIVVRGAKNQAEAKRAAVTVAKSSLVKTALFGEDANWGRIMAALGYSGVDMDESRTDITIGKAKLVEKGLGQGKAVDREAALALKQREVRITIDLHKGKAESTILTCDLSNEYININANYRS